MQPKLLYPRRSRFAPKLILKELCIVYNLRQNARIVKIYRVFVNNFSAPFRFLFFHHVFEWFPACHIFVYPLLLPGLFLLSRL